MKKLKTAVSVISILSIIFSIAGCASLGNGKYNVVARLDKQKLCVAFREGDRCGDAVTAALRVLQSDGDIDELSRKWFGDNRSLLKGDEEALSELEFDIEPRTFIVGYDSARLPFSGQITKGVPTGFDVELAKMVCDKLGWRVKYVAINTADAKTELDSGNVDCVWGGYAYDENAKGISQSPVYLENTVVVASLSGSGVRSSGSLSGKTLALSENGGFSKVLENNSSLAEKPQYIIKLPGGCDECFKALEDGSCDAIITDLDAVEYYK